MINHYFGIKHTPFDAENIELLPQQQAIFEIIISQYRMRGLTLILGQPGTGKTLIKETLQKHDTKRIAVPVVSRTLHTYHSTLRILCEAFDIDFEDGDHKCERQLIDEAYRLNRANKIITPVIDDAQYMSIECLRKIRLLLEDFPKNHNLILISHPALRDKLQLTVNEDINSRITWSGELKPLAPDDMHTFIIGQLDKAGMAHTTFDDQALNLIIQSAEGILRNARNLCLSSLIEAVRDQTKTVTLKQVNRTLMQPHWRRQYDTQIPTNNNPAHP